MRLIASIALLLAAALYVGVVRADPGRGGGQPPRAELLLYAQAHARMSPEERARLREQLRSADRSLYRTPGQGGESSRRRFEPPREARPQTAPSGSHLSPEQRERLREDIQNAYRRRGRE